MSKHILNIILLITLSLNCSGQLKNTSWIYAHDVYEKIILDIFEENTTITRIYGNDSIRWDVDTIPANINKNNISFKIDEYTFKLKLDDSARLVMPFNEDNPYTNNFEYDSVINNFKNIESHITFHRIPTNENIITDSLRHLILGKSYISNSSLRSHDLRLDFISEENFILFWSDELGEKYFQIDFWDIYDSPNSYDLLLTGGSVYLAANPIIGYDENSINLTSYSRNEVGMMTLSRRYNNINCDSIKALLNGEWNLVLANGDSLNSDVFIPPPPPPGIDTNNLSIELKYIFNQDLSYEYKYYYNLRKTIGDWSLSETGDYIILDANTINAWGDRSKILLIENLSKDRLVIKQFYRGYLIGMPDFATFEFRRITTPNTQYKTVGVQ